jgi:hypothetical protein
MHWLVCLKFCSHPRSNVRLKSTAECSRIQTCAQPCMQHMTAISPLKARALKARVGRYVGPAQQASVTPSQQHGLRNKA